MVKPARAIRAMPARERLRMERVAEYRRWASEVEQFAQTVGSDERRRMKLEVARSLRIMADQREVHLLRGSWTGSSLELERRPLAPKTQVGKVSCRRFGIAHRASPVLRSIAEEVSCVQQS